jgi:hypothetical protein
MKIFSTVWHVVQKVRTLINRATTVAGANGLTDDVTRLALQWVKVAAGKQLDNAQKREFVVQILMGKHVPESVARLAVELAVQVMKRELKKIG